MTPTVESIRDDFPILNEPIHDRPLVYLDNAATTLKPRSVTERVREYYDKECSNVHRGVHALSERATASFEATRENVRGLINAASRNEIVFTRGTTEAINLVAQSFGRANFGPGDEIVVSHMEHHSNIVPWQLLCEEKGCTLQVAPILDNGELDFEAYTRLLGPRTKLVSIVYVSNSLGTVNPVQAIVDAAHAHDIPVLVDGAQAIATRPVDVRRLGCDFFAFSGHKMFGPTGVGVLYGKEALLDAMPPVQGGGDMIASVTFEKTTYNTLPYKFEAGTPNIAGVIGLGAAVDYLHGVGFDWIMEHENDLLAYATQALEANEDVRIVGTAAEKSAVVSFVVDGVHPHDIGTIADADGVALRTGHHCTQPVMQRFGIPATARMSFSIYNRRSEIDVACQAVERARSILV